MPSYTLAGHDQGLGFPYKYFSVGTIIITIRGK